jgi:hypothetical protein
LDFGDQYDDSSITGLVALHRGSQQISRVSGGGVAIGVDPRRNPQRARE